jgi:hypothetical protein
MTYSILSSDCNKTQSQVNSDGVYLINLSDICEGGIAHLPKTSHESERSATVWRELKFSTSAPNLIARRLYSFARNVRSFPTYATVYVQSSHSRKWVIYFCYFEGCELPAQCSFTIEKLKQESFSVLVVHACERERAHSDFRRLGVNWLIWKERRGYDFSGYTIGLTELVRHQNEVDVVVLNDSVLGPFCSLDSFLQRSSWDFTAAIVSRAITLHCVSFCFFLKKFDYRKLSALSTVLSHFFSFDNQGPVSMIQETRLAAQASKTMSVGTILDPMFGSDEEVYLLLGNPEGLLRIGFPFLKRSIFGKLAANFDQDHYRRVLMDAGHPPVW